MTTKGPTVLNPLANKKMSIEFEINFQQCTFNPLNTLILLYCIINVTSWARSNFCLWTSFQNRLHFHYWANFCTFLFIIIMDVLYSPFYSDCHLQEKFCLMISLKVNVTLVLTCKKIKNRVKSWAWYPPPSYLPFYHSTLVAEMVAPSLLDRNIKTWL